jgi:rubrerythrin
MIKHIITITLFSLIAFAAAQESLKVNLQVLNYALTLEHLENAYYRDALAKFSSADAVAAGLTDTDYTYITAVGKHEADHVSTLTAVITKLGGTPVQECTYAFPYANNFTEFIKFAATLENTGVSAYDGAIAMITVPELATAGATIATIEARHASYFNNLIGVSPFPQSFDTPLNMSQILAIAGPLITACPAANSQCGGVDAAQSSACSGHGQCMSANLCLCASGYEGPICEQAVTAAPTSNPNCASTSAPATSAPASTSGPATTAAPTTSAPATSSPASTSGPATPSTTNNANLSGDNNARASNGASSLVAFAGLIIACIAVALL